MTGLRTKERSAWPLPGRVWNISTLVRPTKSTGAKQRPKEPRSFNDELFAGIRSGKPIDNDDDMTRSTLMAIMGRMATYTGQQITWEQTMHWKEDLSPDKCKWDAKPPVSEVAVPGVTGLV